MRFLAAMAVVTGVVFGAQGASAQTDEPRFMLSLNGAFEPGDETFTDESPLRLYDEAGRLTVSGRSSTGALLDMGVAARVTGRFTLGLSAHRGASSDDATVTGQAPHPLFFNRPRSFSVVVPDTKRIEQALHFSGGMLIALGEKLDVHIYGGPTQFRFSQQVVGDVLIREANAANTAVDVTPTIVARKKNVWGGHVAADFSYPLFQIGNGMFRLGGLVRYAAASSEFQVLTREGEANANSVTTKLGGMQIGAGVRVRF